MSEAVKELISQALDQDYAGKNGTFELLLILPNRLLHEKSIAPKIRKTMLLYLFFDLIIIRGLERSHCVESSNRH